VVDTVPGLMHNKVMIIDGATVITGTDETIIDGEIVTPDGTGGHRSTRHGQMEHRQGRGDTHQSASGTRFLRARRAAPVPAGRSIGV
jgi:hypothetical protein